MNYKPATIQDVARVAQVSTATVSRALSNPDLLADATREAVFQAIQTTGYRVNQAARNLRMRRAGAVLVLVPDLGKPFYSRCLAGISDGFANTDYAVLIADTESQPLKPGALADYFLNGRIDGVIVLDGRITLDELKRCEEQGVSERIVFLCEWVEAMTLPAITSDNAGGSHLAMQHLYDLGHRKIAHAEGPAGNVLTIARSQAMLNYRAQKHLPWKDEWLIPGDFSVESGYAAARAILAMDERPTAVYCSADTVAFGLMAGLQAQGVRVPQDMSVVGFDDIDIAQYSVPALTTIRQDRHRLGYRTAEALLARLRANGEGLEDGSKDQLDVELVIRDSTGPPPSSA